MISVDDYIEAFRVLLPDLHERKAAALQQLALHRATGITARQVAEAIGGEAYGAANIWIGQFGKLLYRHLKRYPADVVPVSKKNYWRMLATGGRISGGEFRWYMRPEVFHALVALDFVKLTNAAFQLPEEIAEADWSLFKEGAVTSVLVNTYERDSRAREACVTFYGYCCSCCGVDLQRRYKLKRQHIHVHHLNPIAARGGEYNVDAIKDLRPVCPNCHSIIHLSQDILTIQQVRDMLQSGLLSDDMETHHNAAHCAAVGD